MERHRVIKHIVILVSPYSTTLDMSGPMDVFQKAIEHIHQLGRTPEFDYRIHIVSMGKTKTIEMSSGISVISEGSYKTIRYPIDTLIIAGRSQRKEHLPDAAVLKWLREQAKVVRRICSVCAAAFVLADAGLLANRKATTHWMLCEKMARAYPDISVQMDAIFVKDGNIYTSAGITAGIDLALALIEEDLGKKYALLIARILVMFLKRPGNQTQFSMILEAQQIDHQPVSQAIEWITTHLHEEITVEKLAELVLMSPRNFARVFVRESGITPMKYVEKVRLETACRQLTETNLTIEQIANRCGFRNSLNMNRTFTAVFRTTPSQYRRDFRTAL
ncbi:MAG: GlxA family transcriptional regulator [Tannerellaceae bacterium]|nr:GlxA family transcriptional regulator [Tannerellaceae bacterium]